MPLLFRLESAAWHAPVPACLCHDAPVRTAQRGAP